MYSTKTYSCTKLLFIWGSLLFFFYQTLARALPLYYSPQVQQNRAKQQVARNVKIRRLPVLPLEVQVIYGSAYFSRPAYCCIQGFLLLDVDWYRKSKGRSLGMWRILFQGSRLSVGQVRWQNMTFYTGHYSYCVVRLADYFISGKLREILHFFSFSEHFWGVYKVQ